jgi:hypothetical protein
MRDYLANDVPQGMDARKMQIAYGLLALLSLRYISYLKRYP